MELEIEGLLDEGWKPRIKKRKKLRYITLRKGNQEKSLGPYTEELWEKVKPVDAWATPAQILELEKRIGKIEKTKRRENTSFDAELLKRIKKLEESQQGSNSSLLEKRITQLEESQKGATPYLLKRRIRDLEESQRLDIGIINKSITDFRKLTAELLESAGRRQIDNAVCKQMNDNGFCLLYYFSYDEVEKLEYLKPIGYSEHEGEKVYHIKVREHPLVCSACPDYEPKS